MPISPEVSPNSKNGIVTVPAEREGFDLHAFARENDLPGEFLAQQLAAFVQRVAEGSALSGHMPQVEDWKRESEKITTDIFTSFSSHVDPQGQNDTLIGFSRLFLAGLAGEDISAPRQFNEDVTKLREDH